MQKEHLIEKKYLLITILIIIICSSCMFFLFHEKMFGYKTRSVSNDVAQIRVSKLEPKTPLPVIHNQDEHTSLLPPEMNNLLQTDIAKAVAVIDRELEMKQHIQQMKKADIEIHSKWDLSEAEAKKTSTKDLLSHFMNSPLTTEFDLYADARWGIERAMQSSISLQEFVSRPDLADAIGDYYANYPYDPEIKSSEDADQIRLMQKTFASTKKEFLKDETKIIIGVRSMRLLRSDQFIKSPFVIGRLAGHEKRILKILARRAVKIKQIQAKYGYESYSAASTGAYNLSLSLLKQLNPAIKMPNPNFSSKDWESNFYDQIGAL